jgi:hypothetical protein
MFKRCATIALGIAATAAAVLALATAGSAAPDQNTWGTNNGAWNNSNPSHTRRNGPRYGYGYGYNNGNGNAYGRQHRRDYGGRDDRRRSYDRDDRRRNYDRDDRQRHHRDRG